MTNDLLRQLRQTTLQSTSVLKGHKSYEPAQTSADFSSMKAPSQMDFESSDAPEASSHGSGHCQDQTTTVVTHLHVLPVPELPNIGFDIRGSFAGAHNNDPVGSLPEGNINNSGGSLTVSAMKEAYYA